MTPTDRAAGPATPKTVLHMVVHVAPHERHEAIEAYGDKLTLVQMDLIRDAPDGAWLRLHLTEDGCQFIEGVET